MNNWPAHLPCSNPEHCRVTVCDVCFIVRGDTTPKPAKWCPFCKSWICETCRPAVKDRAVAAMKVKLGLAKRWELPSLKDVKSDNEMEEVIAKMGV